MSRDSYKIHFIGIGGIGISGLARLFLVGGKNFFRKFVGTGHCPVPTLMVTGSDLVQSEITKDLEKLGAEIFIGRHKKENLFFLSPILTFPLLIKGGRDEEPSPLIKGKQKGLLEFG